MSIEIRPGTSIARNRWKNNPVIAVDLGMSENNSTTGFSYAPDDLFEKKSTSFGVMIGQCTDLICDLIKKGKHPAIALIIEAPLSFGFNKDGNPCSRDPIEVDDQLRPWHHQPACGLGLLAVLFLRRILAASQPIAEKVDLHVFEGFISGNITDPGPPPKHRSHRRDAFNLVKAFNNPSHGLVVSHGATGSLLPTVNAGIDGKIPAIIQVRQDDYEFI